MRRCKGNPQWYFYPRSPCGERPANAQADANNHGFLSTLSLRRATAERYAAGLYVGDFYPRSPCGERHGTEEL